MYQESEVGDAKIPRFKSNDCRTSASQQVPAVVHGDEDGCTLPVRATGCVLSRADRVKSFLKGKKKNSHVAALGTGKLVTEVSLNINVRFYKGRDQGGVETGREAEARFQGKVEFEALHGSEL